MSRRALIISNWKYEAEDPAKKKLDYPEKNVTAIEEVLRDKCGFQITRRSNVKKASFKELADEWIPQNAPNVNSPDSIYLLYYSGHGFFNSAQGDQYLVPIDADVRHDSSWVNIHDLVRPLNDLIGSSPMNKKDMRVLTSTRPPHEGTKVLFILDCCRSNLPALPGEECPSLTSAPGLRAVTQLIFVYACDPSLTAGESSELKGGFLTKAFVEALEDPSSIDQGFSDLFHSIRSRCLEASKGKQRPWMCDSSAGRLVLRERRGDAQVTEGQNQESEEDRAERARKAQEKDMKLGYWMFWPHFATILIDGHSLFGQAPPVFLRLAMVWSLIMFLAETLFVVTDRKLFCPVQNYGDYVFLVLDFLKFALASFAVVSDARVHKDDFTKLSDVAFVARLIFYGVYVVLLFRERVSKFITRILWSAAEYRRPFLNQQSSSSSSPP